MAAKPQRSIRFDDEAYNGVLRVQLPDENFTATVNRVLIAGVGAIESETQAKREEAKSETQAGRDETQVGYDERDARYIKRLEEENARLIAEHEADRAAIAIKDKQIAEALTRAHDLASQSNAVALAAQERKQIPATTTGGEITVVMDGEPTAQETAHEAPAQAESAEPVEEPKKRGLWARLWE